MTNREKLHRLVDELSEAELGPTLRLVETQRHDPVLQALANAAEDDEPWTDEDEAAVAESRKTSAVAARSPMRRCSASTDDRRR